MPPSSSVHVHVVIIIVVVVIIVIVVVVIVVDVDIIDNIEDRVEHGDHKTEVAKGSKLSVTARRTVRVGPRFRRQDQVHCCRTSADELTEVYK